LLAQIDPSWLAIFGPYQARLDLITEQLENEEIAPPLEKVFRVFSKPVTDYRVVIVGQDPYPTPGYANGLAFSVEPNIKKLPASLRNIFNEYTSDTGFATPKSGDLSSWASNGVALINSSLSLNLRDKKAHLTIGWQAITSAALTALALQGSIAILWGSHAQKVGSVFDSNSRIESVHPSPLSAYRGFFGSKPFSRCNEMLIASEQNPIDWNLG
jgi:uracil-DNA glycosylase